MYQPLPHDECTRILEIVSATNGKLVLRMVVADLTLIAPHDDSEDQAAEEDASRFDALSYTWGSPVSGEEYEAMYGPANDVEIAVMVDNTSHSMKIGRNLYEALIHIHTAVAYSRPLWVDAICINQVDNKEKMIVWLGKDVFDDFEHIIWLHETVLELIDEYVAKNGSLTRGSFDAWHDDVAEQGVNITAVNDFVIPDNALYALYRFYATRRYLSRAWVTQEVALSHECVVLLGEKEIDFEKLYALPCHFGDLGGLTARYIYGDMKLATLGNEAIALGATGFQIQNWSTSSMVGDLQILFGSHNDETCYLALMEYFLSQSTRRLATNPRDLIYCLLGMVKHVMPGVKDPFIPDYTATVDDVFTQVTRHLLLSLPHRTILSLVTDKPVHNDYVQRLPSWVPDFATCSELCQPIRMRMTAMTQKVASLNAGLDGPPDLGINGKQLSLFGRRCAAIDFSFRLLNEWSPEQPSMRDVRMFTSLLKAAMEIKARGKIELFGPILRVLCHGEPLIEDEDYFCVLWRRFLARCVIEPRQQYPVDPAVMAATEELVRGCEGLVGHAAIPSESDIANEEAMLTAMRSSKGPDPDELGPYLDMILSMSQVCPGFPYDKEQHERMVRMSGSDQIVDEDDAEFEAWAENADQLYAYYSRRVDPRSTDNTTFFTTTKHNVGRIYGTLQPGDELWLICQAKVPFILRPVDDANYMLVGEAFVHGALQGELIRDGVAEEPIQITIV